MRETAQQLECVRRANLNEDLAVNAGPGTGKGLRSDQPVITPKGYVAIGNLKHGDLVYGSDGNAYPVLGVYYRGILPLYVVSFNDGQSVITDGDHRWLCKTLSERKKDRPAVVRTTSELIDLNKNVFLPMTQPLTGNPVTNEIDPWLLGALLGDGGFSSGSIMFTNSETSMLDSVRNALPCSCSLAHSALISWRINGNGKGRSNDIKESLRSMGLYGCRSHDKFVPEHLLNADAETRLSILQGLLDTDGYTDGYVVEYSTTSRQLALDVIRIVESFGGLCRMKEKPSHYTKTDGSRIKCRLSYRITIRLPASISPFRNSEKKLLRYIPKTKYPPARQIVSIKRTDPGESVCIEVGSPDHLFLTVGHAVTHNTTLLRLIAKAKPGQPIVNFCYNRSTKQQADATMPAWVKNYTFHGAAYGYCGKYYAKKLNVKLSPKVIAGRFGCDESIAMAAKYTLRRFAVSEDNCITGWHVPREAVLAQPERERETFKDDVVLVARKTWLAAMDNYKDMTFGVEHDFYVKRWVDEGAKLPGRYETVLVDECQDMVRANVKALRLIRGQKICVGDRNQQLYDFRQTVNVADEMVFDGMLDLTISHRFGPEIAAVANQVLDLFPKPQPHLTGVGQPSEIAYGRCDDRHTVLCRSNAGLLMETLNAVRQGKQVHVVGSLIDGIQLIESAWWLSIGEVHKVKHPTLKMIGDWGLVLDMAKEDQELAMAVKRVDELSSEIPFICEELRNAGETSRDRADVILSTVHKAKGDEFEVVRLADDYPDLIRWNRKERRYLPMKGELCVFFVAVTRAKRKLYANSVLTQLSSWKEMLSDE